MLDGRNYVHTHDTVLVSSRKSRQAILCLGHFLKGKRAALGGIRTTTLCARQRALYLLSYQAAHQVGVQIYNTRQQTIVHNTLSHIIMY